MQTLSDVMGVTIKVPNVQQSGALGSAMNAATAARVSFGGGGTSNLAQGYLTFYAPTRKERIYMINYMRGM